MPQKQSNVTLSAPGFAGLNTQDSPIDMDPSFASVAENCVIDEFGRIGSRKGFSYVTTNPSVLSGNPIVSMGEFIDEATGATSLFVCGNNKIFKQNLGTPNFELSEMTLPAGAPSNDNWKMAQLNNKFFFVQSGEDPLVYDPAVSTTALANWAATPTNMGSDGQPNTIAAAYGRLWVADFDNNSTVVAWSGLLDGEEWSGHGVGSLQTSEYWPSGYDEVTAIAAHNNFLVIFGLSNILLYTTDSDVINNITLSDTIEGIGCIARDSVVPTGIDFMFTSATGIRSLNRTIQEKSIPIGDMSRNVRREFQSALSYEANEDIKSVFHVEDSFHVTFLPSNPIAYVFDTWSPLQDGSHRATVWTGLNLRCGVRTRDRVTYFGGIGGVFQYTGAVDVSLADDDITTSTVNIPFRYITHPLDFGSSSGLIFPKQVHVSLIGGSSGSLNLLWSYDFKDIDTQKTKVLEGDVARAFWVGSPATNDSYFEWNDPETYPANVGRLGYWTAQQNIINNLKYNIWGSGRNVKIGFSSDISGESISIQEISIQVLQGRLV